MKPLLKQIFLWKNGETVTDKCSAIRKSPCGYCNENGLEYSHTSWRFKKLVRILIEIFISVTWNDVMCSTCECIYDYINICIYKTIIQKVESKAHEKKGILW